MIELQKVNACKDLDERIKLLEVKERKETLRLVSELGKFKVIAL